MLIGDTQSINLAQPIQQSQPIQKKQSFGDLNLSHIQHSFSKDADDDNIMLADLAKEILSLIQNNGKEKEGNVRQSVSVGDDIASSQFVSFTPEEETQILASLQKVKSIISQKLTQDLQNIQDKNTEAARTQLRKHLIMIIKEINQLNQSHGLDRWKKVRGGQGDKINQQTRAIDDFIQQFSRILITLEEKHNTSESSFAIYADTTHSRADFIKAKKESKLDDIIKAVELQGSNENPPQYSQSKTSSEIQGSLKSTILELVKAKKSTIANSVEVTLVLMSTESTEQGMQKHIFAFLAKIPQSENWKRILSILFQRYAFACLQSQSPGQVLDKVSPVPQIDSSSHNYQVVQDNNLLFH